jgi:hypothetical protein
VSKEEDFSVPLKVADSEFKITYQPNADSAVATALSFCREHGQKFGITEATFMQECLNPVGEYLKRAAETEIAARAQRRRQLADATEAARQLAQLPDNMQVPMKIGDTTYSISWNSRRTNARNMAIKFCTEQGEAINASFEDCLAPVQAYLVQQEARAQQGKQTAAVEDLRVVKAKVDVAGREYEFRFEPSEADALRVARGFCKERGAELGVLQEQVEQQCVSPILKVLMVALEQVK